ncbi:MAG: dephospho-CoA kinase [Gammaproteobacteria bacterium]|jgi:dephospho-CoA kinase
MTKTLCVALTGGIGCGKSTVSSIFQALGVPIIDSDVISRSIVKPGKPCLNAIIDEFGDELLDTRGELDRHKLRTIIFNDSEAKRKLEDILHPAIYQEIERKVSNIDYPYCLVAVPLLIETQATDKFDRILLVDVPEDIQLTRASERDKTSRKFISEIIKNQASREQRLNYADDIIDNSVKIDELNDVVEKLHEQYLKLSGLNKT